MMVFLSACSTPMVREVGRSAADGRVELRGVGAGPFVKNAANWLPDRRFPLIEPLAGPFRNIYAPSIVALPDGEYRIFFGGWDGTPTGNDGIYCIGTRDFLSFYDRRKVIVHGAYEHVCNVSAVLNDDGSYTLMCTAYPDEHGLNKPAIFRIPGDFSHCPVIASSKDVVTIDGYPDYAGADINGMNPIIRDGGKLQLYFADFHRFGKIYLADQKGKPRQWSFRGVAMDFAGMPNDIKRVGLWNLLALHQNGPKLFWSISQDPGRFPEPKVLAEHYSDADRFMVAVGLVTRDQTVLGFLYGAGAVPALNQNRIFARWLQRKVLFRCDDGRRIMPEEALGPDRALLRLSARTTGRLEIYGEDGQTLLGRSDPITLIPGVAYRIRR